MGAPLRWFPFDVDAWDTDEIVRRMTYAERGVYVSLLCWQWREGSVPADPKSLAKALGASRGLVAHVLAKAFIDDGTNSQRLINARLAETYANQLARSDRASAAGRASADRRLTKSLAGRRVSVDGSLDGRCQSVDRSLGDPLPRSRIRSEIEKSLSVPPNQQKVNGESPQAVEKC